MYYSLLQQALNPHLHGRYVSPLSAALNQRPPGSLLNFGVTPSALLAVLHDQDQRRNAMIAGALHHYSSLGLAGLDPSSVLDALFDEDNEDEECEPEDADSDSENEVTPSTINPVNLAACREAVKAELADLEKQRKALNGQQNALSRRFAEVEGKFRLLKQLENGTCELEEMD